MVMRAVVTRFRTRALQQRAVANEASVAGLRAFSTDAPNAGQSTPVAQAAELESTNESGSVIASVSLATASANEKLKFFELSKDLQKKLFPEGINRRTESMFEFVGHRHTMLRKKTFEILEAMRNETYKQRHFPAFVIDGARGTGKSIALQQIVQFARESGWIVLYVPRARAWCQEGPYVMRSPYISGKFDIDEMGVDLLQKFVHCHKEQLSQIKLRGDYGDRYYPSSLAAKPKDPSTVDRSSLTLLDLVESGIRDEELACTAVVDLRNELAQVTEFPVLIAVDEFNTLYQETVFGYEGKAVWPEDISVVDALRDFDEKGLKPERRLKNGLFIAATTENFPSRHQFKKQVNYKSFKKTMGLYSSEEFDAALDYYNHIQFFHDKPDESQKAYLRQMTKSLPLHVYNRVSIS